MQLPAVEQPQRYRGLYVFDFGSWTALGYTAEEVAMLLESEQYRGGKVYKIVRASPEGALELKGVTANRFHAEAALFHSRSTLEAARQDFDELVVLAATSAPPCRAFVHLADRGPGAPAGRYVTALIYPAEYDDEIGRWLLDANYRGGDSVEGGASGVAGYYAERPQILERRQLWSASTHPSRSADEVFSSVRRAIQR